MYLYNLGMLFCEVSRQNTDKNAIIIDGSQNITYDELNVLSNKIAHFFLDKKICKREVVAIQNKKSKLGFAAMIACLKLGIIYTNFDYTNPRERIKKIFSTAMPRLVFADEYNKDIHNLSEDMNIEYFDAGSKTDLIQLLPCDLDYSYLYKVTGDNPAYIMFTSGSTGVPKGVVICHRSLLNFISWGKDTYNLSETDIMTNVNPIYFDNSVFDFYCAIFNGITLVSLSKSIVDKPKEMLDIIEKTKCTFWFSVPSMLIYLTNLKLLSKEILRNIRVFSFGGEGYPKELLRKLYACYSDTADFYNVYGPTEGTCICSAYKITSDDIESDGLAPLGSIAPNFCYLILDENNNESTFGELCLIGEQLALGYYNDVERTEKSFVNCSDISAYNVRMYRTGDLVQIIDEKLFFRGRVDNQIKHMGYRIELEEIESAIIKLRNVIECAVVHTTSKNGFSRIVAFVSLENENGDVDRNFKTELRDYIPQYMIPNSFTILDFMPKNENGKIDRKKLKEYCN